MTTKQIKSRAISVLAILFISGCIDPLVVKFSSSFQSLVVQGMITDDPGPYQVKLTRTLDLATPLNTISTVSNAAVTIYDDEENQEQLTAVSPGVYETTNFQGVVGRSYHIK